MKKIQYISVIQTIFFFSIVMIPIYGILLSPFFTILKHFYTSTVFFQWISSYTDTQLAQSFLNRSFAALWSILILGLWHRFIDQRNTIYTVLYNPLNKKFQYLYTGILVQTSILATALIIIFFAGHITKAACLPSLLSIIMYYLISGIILALTVFTEELLFRGYILQKFATVLDHNSACVLSTLLFMIMHPFHTLGLYGIITQAGFLGLAFAYIAFYYRSIYVTFGFHFANNLIVRSLYSPKLWDISSATLFGTSLVSLYYLLCVVLFVVFFISKQLWKQQAYTQTPSK